MQQQSGIKAKEYGMRKAMFAHRNTRTVEKMRNQIKERYRIDPDAVLEQREDENFSFREARRSYMREARRYNLSEAVSSTAFSQLLLLRHHALGGGRIRTRTRACARNGNRRGRYFDGFLNRTTRRCTVPAAAARSRADKPIRP